MAANPDYVIRSWQSGIFTTEEAAELLHWSVIRFLIAVDAMAHEASIPIMHKTEIDITRMSKDEIIGCVSLSDIGVDEAAFALGISEEEVQKLVGEWVDRYMKRIEEEYEAWQEDDYPAHDRSSEPCCPVCKAPLKRERRDGAINLLCEECGNAEAFFENPRCVRR